MKDINTAEDKEISINLIQLVRLVLLKKILVIKITSCFFVFGIVVAFTSPKEYETLFTLIPEAIESKGNFGGSLSGLATLAGIDFSGLNGNNATINPGLYRKVAQSTPFLTHLLDQSFFFESLNKQVVLKDYYLNYYETSLLQKILALPGKLINLLIGGDNEDEGANEIGNISEILSFTEREQAIIYNLKERILVTMDWELNIVTIYVKMQDARAAAQIANFTFDYITEYVTKYSVSKSTDQLVFIEGQFKEKKREFEKIQMELAVVKDRNININTVKAKSEIDRLESEYNLISNIYNQLALQREKLKLQVNENTPVFTILEPITVPNRKSEPRRLLIMIVSIFLGITFSVFIILFKSWTLDKKW